MECQKIINLLDNALNQSTKFWTKNWVEINDDVRGTKSNLKHQCLSQVYVIIVMHMYL